MTCAEPGSDWGERVQDRLRSLEERIEDLGVKFADLVETLRSSRSQITTGTKLAAGEGSMAAEWVIINIAGVEDSDLPVATCACSRRIWVMQPGLAEAPITCGACGVDFRAGLGE